MLKAIDQFETRDVLKSMQDSVRRLQDEAGDAQFVAGEYARRQAGRSIRKGLKRLLDEAPALAAPEQHERHHAMRIAAKRLRYTLELARPVYSNDLTDGDSADRELSDVCEAVKRLQTLLGEIHDCDVWIETFAEFAHKECGEIELYFGTSRALRAFAARVRLSRAGAKGSPPPGLRRVGDRLAGAHASRGLGSSGGNLGVGRHAGEIG